MSFRFSLQIKRADSPTLRLDAMRLADALHAETCGYEATTAQQHSTAHSQSDMASFAVAPRDRPPVTTLLIVS